MTYRPAPARYYGGKNELNGLGTNEWIRSKLPWSWRSCYVEPFAGMLGVLVSRPRVRIEVANDADGRIVNWWRVVRRRADELKHEVEWTPYSEEELKTACATIDEGDELERARKFTVVLIQSIALSVQAPRFRHSFVKECADHRHRLEGDLIGLRDRIKDVVLYRRDAVDIIERSARFPNTVVYCDPPYMSANTEPYAVADFDRNRLVDALLRHRGRVAISGYGSEWDDLGWRRYEHETISRMSVVANPERAGRTEVLWTNYPPPANQGEML